jgi:ABC-type multidrug transport system fused ATPase/permease subunit
MTGLSDDGGMRATTTGYFARTARYLRPYAGIAAADILCAFASLGFYFIFPQVTQYIIDDIIGGKRMHLLLPVIAGLAGAFLLCGIFRAIGIMLNTRFEQSVIFDMRNDVYARLMRLPVGYFDGRASGDLMTRVTDDITGVHRVLIDGTEQGATAIVTVIAVAAILFAKNAVLTMYALIPLGILVAGALWYTLSAHRRYRWQRKAIGAMNALLMDNLQGIRQIKAFGREQHEDGRFARRADELRRSTFGVMRVWAVYSPAMAFAGSLGMVLVLWMGGPMVTAGSMTLGELVGFLFYLSLFYEPIGRLHGLNQLVQSGRAAGERVFDILDATEEDSERAGTGTFDGPVRGEVRFENVSFNYDGRGDALKGISLSARPGQMIALVGATGSGKTTLVNLIPAFYRPSGGRITIDSRDIADVSLASLRSLVGIVSQEAFLFNGTVRENILYGKPDASGQQLEEAARAANCHDFITRLPDGYDTRVGERGVRLSVGEKQRVSIARALLKDPPILILDEATASVDTATEKTIQEALQRLMVNRTSFVIAHRLSTIINADQILVLARGEIVERGTHEELLAREGVYARLCAIQNMDLIEEGDERNKAAR